MKIQSRPVRLLSLLIFSVGVLLGMALLAVVVWADFEATLFNPAMRQDASLRTLRCPVIITTKETGTVSATFKNPLERSTEFFVRAHITDGYVTLMKQMDSKLPLAPGERQRLQWTVAPDDAAFGMLILVKVIARGGYPLPSRQGTCGVLVVDWPHLTGTQILALTGAASLLGMAVGAGLWVAASRRPLQGLKLEAARAMGTVAGTILVGTVVGLIGWWVPGGIMLVITLLAIGVSVGYFADKLAGETTELSAE